MISWDTPEVRKFTAGWTEKMKGSVAKSVLSSDIINKFMSTLPGSLVFDKIIDMMTAELQAILEMCESGVEENIEKIQLSALKIKVAKAFMYNIASMTQEGDALKASIKKEAE